MYIIKVLYLYNQAAENESYRKRILKVARGENINDD